MTKSDAQELKALSAQLNPTVWIGKNGVNDSIVIELRRQLKLTKMVKVKILKAALLESSREQTARELEHASGARLVDLKGAAAVYLSPFHVKRKALSGRTDQRK
ncbi:MAG TPA: YhbY family RNA-binding protein [Candidatus Bathyarchaeia archaeon]|nr:YhbY family RNA-binding protein [Candidatus Bathyarchaeia archaeon]